MAASKGGFPMTGSHFTVFGGSFIHEAHGFAPARKRNAALAVWGLVLGSLLVGATTVATVTATAWAQGAATF